MNVLQLLKERIEDELHKKNKPRTVVFWYDEQGEHTVESLKEELADQPIHVRTLTRNNFFSLKIEIETEKKDESFLIYANFAKPEKEKIICLIWSCTVQNLKQIQRLYLQNSYK
ncbi:hypothetical protein HXV90_18380 [Lysinibacillus sp. JK80]|uniref:hypothetical protein n=1 Tax=Lysinibacillus sp. JK80 TaxID=2749809 RepID=UPI0022B97443|nr:hypothetical protein [Lysinibacillus sp. JK80]WBF57648.1 hypothetical protein HXV90_18380 [Lysinibacillus sp. JK80]